jgi:benzoyl-CoA reductase/2-hydroxyglutaryl-CoA dehydratase subunit BcrC/BadD/HgdB
MVTIPHSISDAGLKWYMEEIFNFKEKLASDFAVRCFDDDLRKAIKVYNESRRLVEELYELRKADAVPLTGAEAMRILLSASIMPRHTFNILLSDALKEIRSRKGITDYKARLMLGGAALDDPRLVEIIEDLGGMVVTDSLCYGSRHFGGMVEEVGDPLKAIAKRYYGKNPCPRMMNEYKNRLNYTEEMARGAKVDGVILQKIVFCDNHGVDSPMIAEDLEANNIPVLILEREHMLSDVGRLRTRVEAFLERIAGR